MSKLSCPKCAIRSSIIIDSRTTRLMGKDVVRRRHVCSNGHRWSTYELEVLLVHQFIKAAKTVKRLEEALKAGRVSVKDNKIIERS